MVVKDEGPLWQLERHGDMIIDRWNRLYKAGYRFESRWISESQWPLVHPNKKAPKLALWSTGRVTLLFAHSDTPAHEVIEIGPEDTREFDRLILRTPKLNLIQELAQNSVGRTIELLVGLAILALIWFGITKLFEWLWPGLKNLW